MVSMLYSCILCQDFLIPDRSLDWQEIQIGEKKFYRFSHLRSVTSYEVKISYPATFPVAFYIELVDERKANPRTGRRLLNTEKMMFATPEDVEQFTLYSKIAVEVEWHGITWKQNLTKVPVVYNIHVGSVVGGIPFECLPHIVCVLASVCFFLWMALRHEVPWPFCFLISDVRSERQEYRKNF